jgi:hypothetical protein
MTSYWEKRRNTELKKCKICEKVLGYYNNSGYCDYHRKSKNISHL